MYRSKVIAPLIIILFIYCSISLEASYPYKKLRQKNFVVFKNYPHAKRIADSEKIPMITIFYLKWDKKSADLINFIRNSRISKFLRDNFIIVAVDMWDNKYDAQINLISHCPTIKIDYLRSKRHYKVREEFIPESFLEFITETLKMFKLPIHYPDDSPEDYPGYREKNAIPAEGPKIKK